MEKVKTKRRFSPWMVLVYALLSAWAVTTLYPLLWVLMNSFKLRGRIVSNSFSLPVGDLFTLDNYTKAFSKLNVWGAYRNSLVISISVVEMCIRDRSSSGQTRR